MRGNMHVNVFSNGELLALVALVAFVSWTASRLWTLRGVRKTARLQAHATASQTGAAEEENRQLRALVERQERRLQSLETIATDPAERTAREIESLRVG